MNPQRLPGRVLMTADAVGGVFTYALELAGGLAASGVAVELATMGRRLFPGQRDEARAVPNLRVHESDFKLEWMDAPWDDVDAAGRWLLELEAQLGPDLVHLSGYAHASLPWSSPVLVAAHSCALSRWRAVKGAKDQPGWDEYSRRARQGLFSADMVVAPSRAMLDSLTTHYGDLPGTRVVRNGRSPDRFAPGAKEDYVLTAGRLWDEAKNIAALHHAAPAIPWPVLAAGDRGPESKGLDRLRKLGALSPEELSKKLSRAWIYALPARYEPLGLSVLEAGLSACALVLGDIDSLRENWEGAALFVDPNDLKALVLAINALIVEPALRVRLAARARARALELHPAAMSEGYLAAYESLLATRRKKGRRTAPEHQSSLRETAHV